VRHGVFLYPWDVVGDPAAVPRVAGLGAPIVSLAASYHSTRAFTPYHPGHRVVEAAEAAAYFAVRPEAWAGETLRPAPAGWMPAPDSFGTAAAALREAGLDVHAWLVLCHGTRLGRAHPDLVVRNSYGDRYSHALCPSHPAVRAYAVRMVAEAARYPVAALELEACGWMGFEHASRHEKSGVALSAVDQALLSVCLCPACAGGLAGLGADPEALAARIRDAVDAGLAGAPRPTAGTLATRMAELVGDQIGAVFALRTQTIAGLLAAVRPVTAGIPLLLMANPDPGHTGSNVGVDLAAVGAADGAGAVDGLLLKANAADSTVAAVFTAARQVLPAAARLEAIVNAVPPGFDEAAALAARVALVGASGGDGIRYYHAGLASPAALAAVRTVCGG
jgi:hypothetical protein